LDPYEGEKENLPFCRKDSLICSKVTEVISSSKEFCQKMGFKVFSEKEVALSGKGCFDGTPSTIKSGSLRRPKTLFEDNGSIL
jgi:hypothetical protein